MFELASMEEYPGWLEAANEKSEIRVKIGPQVHEIVLRQKKIRKRLPV
jgi:hypothetical protein